MQKNVLYAAIILVVASCNQTEKNYIPKVKLLQLTEKNIFDEELVYDVIFDSEELKIDSLKTKSHQLFLQAIDLYKNKNKPEEAITLFKQSILIFPDAKTYYEMGNALLDAKQMTTDLKLSSNASMALEAFEVAEYLKFQPLGTIQYKKACAKNMQIKTGQYSEANVVYCLEEAFNNGFTDTLLLANDDKINSILKTNAYKLMLNGIASKKTDNPKTLFGLYLNSYPVSPGAYYEINYDQVANIENNQAISYDYAKFVPEMQNTSFGREVSHDFFYVAKVVEKENYVAVLYNSVNFWGMEMQPVTTKLVTYDREGSIISSIPFAGQFSAEKIKTGKIENNQITLSDYKRIWKFPITEVSFDENEVEKFELLSKTTFMVDDMGNIKESSLSYSSTVKPGLLAKK